MSVLRFTGYRIGCCACALTALIAGSATAADLSDTGSAPVSYKDVPVAASWTGFYAGVNGGYGWAANSSAYTYDERGILLGLFPYDDSARSNGIDRSGGFGGGQIGFNWQLPGGFKDRPSAWVLGVEADIQGAGISGSSSANGTLTVGGIPFTAPFNDKGSIDWFSTLRARLGYAYGDALFYVTGGFAAGDVKETTSYPGVLVTSLSRDNIDTGYALGAGIEYKVGGAWTVKAEYQLIDLRTYHLAASASDAFKDSETVRSNPISDSLNTVRVGLNYHLNNVNEPLK